MTMRGNKNSGTNRPGRGALASALIAAAILTGGVLPGCQKESDEAQAIRQAKLDFEYLAANHVGVADGSATKKSYEKIVSNLGKAASSSIPGEAAAAKLLRARANARQADLLSTQAASAERRVLDTIVTVRASLNQWKDMNSAAVALTSYDPSKALQGLDGQIVEKEKDITSAQAELSRLQGEVAKLEASKAAAQTSVQAERAREAGLRAQATNKSQTERADLVTKANEAKRAGDGFDKQASDLQAQIAKMSPTVDEAKRTLDAAKSDRALLDIAKSEITRLVRINAEQSKKTIDGETDAQGNTSRYGAKQMADSVTRQVAALRAAREKTGDGDEAGSGRSLMALYEEAEKLYRNAAGEAGKAKGASGVKGGPAELDVATYEHGLADLLMAKARGLQSYTTVMIALAEAKPALADPSFATEAGEAKKLFDETLLAAQDAYTQAKSTYETAGSKVQATQVKDRLDQIARTLATFDPRLPKQPEVEADPKPPTEGTDTAVKPTKEGESPTAPTAPAVLPEGLEGEVLAAVQKLTEDLKKPDLVAFASGVMFKNDKQRDFFTKVAPMQNKTFELDNALHEHFGRSMKDLAEEFSKQIGDSAGLVALANSSPDQLAVEYLRTAEPSDMQVTPTAENPDEVQVTSKSGKLKDPFIMARADGSWKMQLDIPVEAGELTDTFITEISAAYDIIINNVKSNKYNRDAIAMFTDLGAEFVKARNRLLEGKPK